MAKLSFIFLVTFIIITIRCNAEETPEETLGEVIAGHLLTSAQDVRDVVYSRVSRPLVGSQHRIRVERLGLLWCGLSDSAPANRGRFYVSAAFPRLDRCCRAHDLCPLIWDRGECKAGMCNDSFLMPILDCGCEVRFKECLDEVGRESVSFMERSLANIADLGYFKATLWGSERKCATFGQSEDEWQFVKLDQYIK